MPDLLRGQCQYCATFFCSLPDSQPKAETDTHLASESGQLGNLWPHLGYHQHHIKDSKDSLRKDI